MKNILILISILQCLKRNLYYMNLHHLIKEEEYDESEIFT